MKTLIFLTTVLSAGHLPSQTKSVVYSLPTRPGKSITLEPLAVISLAGGVPDQIRPGRAGEVLAFQVHPPKPERPENAKKEPSDPSGEQADYGAAILDLKTGKLSILPGTAPGQPYHAIHRKIDVTANGHSVYVSDREEASVKRFQIADQKLVVERIFEYEDHSRSLAVLTSSAATDTPLILTHPTKTQFLSPDRLLPVTPRYGPQATGAYPPLSNSSAFMAQPVGTFFYRDGCLWQYERGSLVSWKGISVTSLKNGWLSYNGALAPTSAGLSATTDRTRNPSTAVKFVPALTRPLSYRLKEVHYEKFGKELFACRNQGATLLLKIDLPDRIYRHQFISFRANRLVAISQNPPEILVYALDLETTLESLGAPPWVEVTGPGYLNAGSTATFQMRPVFGKFKSLKLLSPLEQAKIRGSKITFSSHRDSPTRTQRISLEFTDKQGRKGTTFFDLNLLENRD